MFFLGLKGPEPRTKPRKEISRDACHRKQFTRQQTNSTSRRCTDAGPIAASIQHRRKDAPIQVAEVVYRNDHGHPRALDVFLACTLPLAEKAARRRAHKLFLYPSDWQLELMYDGAVTTMIDVFQRNYVLKTGDGLFSALSCACAGIRHGSVVFHAKGKR